MKILITFESSHLMWLKEEIKASCVALIIDAKNQSNARKIVRESRIGDDFTTSYVYNRNMMEFVERHNMVEYSLKDLRADTQENTKECVEVKIARITGGVSSRMILRLSKNGVFVPTSCIEHNKTTPLEDNLFTEKAILRMLKDGWEAHFV